MEWKYEEKRICTEDEKGEIVATANIERKENGDIDIKQVYVNPKMRGQSLAEKTMLVVVDYLREEGIKATATCPYASAFFEKNQEVYRDVISEEQKEKSAACNLDGKHE